MKIKVDNYITRNKIKFLFLLAAICWMISGQILRLHYELFSDPVTALAQGSVATITASPLTIQGCDTTQVEIWVNQVSDLYGADIRLSFDPAVLEVIDANASKSGIQVENGGFLVSPFIVYDTADNTAGTIQYVATQLNPTPPATGSGKLFIIRFRTKLAQSTTLTFTYAKLADRNGNTIQSTPISATLTVSGPQTSTLSISRLNATTAHLYWTAASGVSGYKLYRGTAPYFTPTDPPYQQLTGLSYDDVGALGNVNTNYYYVLKSVCSSGLASAISNRVGEYDFSLKATAVSNYNDVALVLNVAGVNKASMLSSYIGSSVKRVLRYNASTQSFQSYDVGDPDTDFNLSIGQFLFVVTDSTAPASFALVGGVPAAGSVSFSLISGSPPRYNFLSLPLDRSNPTLASQVAASVGSSVYGVIRYQINTQSYQRYDPGDPDTDFSLVIGDPFGLILKPGAPANWP